MDKKEMTEQEIWNWLISNISKDLHGTEDGSISYDAVIEDMEFNNVPCDTQEIKIMVGEAIDYCS